MHKPESESESKSLEALTGELESEVSLQVVLFPSNFGMTSFRPVFSVLLVKAVHWT